MIIYNVTINVENDVHDEWLKWMRESHIPDVLKTGYFLEHKICKVLNVEDEGTTYSIQYTCNSMEDYEGYKANEAARLQKEVMDKFKGKFVAFRSLLEVI
jgi:hypothetical protein